MTLLVSRDRAAKTRPTVSVRAHAFAVDEPSANGGEDTGPMPHDLSDSARGACTARW
jgi:putative redox protein